MAAIVAAAEFLTAHPEVPHGPVRLAFTPDEEVGAGTRYFEVAKLGARYGYTLDGGERGEIECETFAADAMTVTFQGRNTHAGYARREIDRKYDFRYSHLLALFGWLLREGRIQEAQLAGRKRSSRTSGASPRFDIGNAEARQVSFRSHPCAFGPGPRPLRPCPRGFGHEARGFGHEAERVGHEAERTRPCAEAPRP